IGTVPCLRSGWSVGGRFGRGRRTFRSSCCVSERLPGYDPVPRRGLIMNGTENDGDGRTMQVWIGTSGYSYTDWVGDFYPEGTRPERMLAVYARHFPIVELNFTFYRPPTRAMLLRLAEKAPAGFQFLVKLPQVISHDHRPMEIPGFRD